MNKIIVYFLIVLSFSLTSCESDAERQLRLQREEQQQIELAQKRKAEEERRAKQLEQERIAREAKLEEERKEKEIHDRWINNSLHNGATPFSYCYGGNQSCSDWGCSQINVRTPYNSDVLVTIKKNGRVVRHAYIKKSSSYTFELPNGTYQPYFYYGKGWNPNKFMMKTSCGDLIGGFIDDEHFGKDDPQQLNNAILEYELILQTNGNFSTRPSNQNEAL